MPKPDRSSGRPQPQETNTAAGTVEPTVSKPGGFKNDPNDAKNPNEAIERHRRKLRPKGPA